MVNTVQHVLIPQYSTVNIDSETADVELLQLLKAGNSQSMRLILSRYESMLIGFANSYTHDLDLAKDIVQESFLKLIKKPPYRLASSSLKPWLFSVTRNLAIDAIRKRKRMQYYDEVPEPSQEGPDEKPLEKEDALILIQKLPDDLRDVVRLRIYGDMTFAEISKQLKIPLGTALWRMQRSLKLLRKELEEVER